MRRYARFSTYGDSPPTQQREGGKQMRKGLVIVGILLLVLGLALTAIGMSAMFAAPQEPPGSDEEFNSRTDSAFMGFGMVGAGFFLMFIGGLLCAIGFGAGRSGYYGRTSSSVNWDGGMGRPANEFPQEGGNIGTSRPPQVGDESEDVDEDEPEEETEEPKGKNAVEKEVVKVKCRECGFLETEDAEFCSKCGKRM